MILHCMKMDTWEKIRNEEYFGHEQIESEGFIHCSPVEYFFRVAPNFREEKEELVLLLIDEDTLSAEVKWEDGDGCGRLYPHIYGPADLKAVIKVLPYLKDSDGSWIMNEELQHVGDK